MVSFNESKIISFFILSSTDILVLRENSMKKKKKIRIFYGKKGTDRIRNCLAYAKR